MFNFGPMQLTKLDSQQLLHACCMLLITMH